MSAKHITFTISKPNTRIYLNPPIKDVKNVEVLDFHHIAKPYINIKDAQQFTNDNYEHLDIVPIGLYSLEILKTLFKKLDKGIFIDNSNGGWFMITSKNFILGR